MTCGIFGAVHGRNSEVPLVVLDFSSSCFENMTCQVENYMHIAAAIVGSGRDEK